MLHNNRELKNNTFLLLLYHGLQALTFATKQKMCSAAVWNHCVVAQNDMPIE